MSWPEIHTSSLTSVLVPGMLVLAAANLPEMSITYSQFSSSVHICTTQNVSLQCKTDDTKWETGPEVLLLWVLKSSNAATLPWG